MDFTIVDVFTDTPLQGNQLAVFGDGPGIPDELQLRLAREINFSESVFVYPPAEAANTARIRIYVPTAEIPFAGHPVLGTAILLAAERGLREVALETGNGTVEVSVDGAFATMRQPLPTVAPFEHADELLRVFGVERSQLPVEIYDNGMGHVYVVLESPEQVAALEPDLGALTRLMVATGHEGSGFNCSAGSGTEWKTRMFAPAQLTSEDPATGSAAGPLAVHLVRHGLVPLDTEITISQGAEIGRPSTLYARIGGASPDAITRVEVSGGAVVVGSGRFTLPT